MLLFLYFLLKRGGGYAALLRFGYLYFRWLFLVVRSHGGSQDGPQHRPKLDLVLGGVYEVSWNDLGRLRWPKMAQDGAKMAQDAPKMATWPQRGPSCRPSRPQDGPRQPETAPKSTLERPRCPQDAVKTAKDEKSGHMAKRSRGLAKNKAKAERRALAVAAGEEVDESSSSDDDDDADDDEDIED